MARKSRMVSSIDYYHVMVRGNNKDKIFKSDVDKEFYILLLVKTVESYDAEVTAWCMLENEAHFIINAEADKLPRIMSTVNTKFAILYNRKYERVGHVFQGRYRCENIENEDFLLNVVRYIHKKPFSLAKKIQKYKWSSYREYLTNALYIDVNQKQYILNIFNNDKKRFKEFHSITDNRKYLRVANYQSKSHVERAEAKIKKFCELHKISNPVDISDDKDLLEELIGNLLLSGNLSNRGIASLTGISKYFVNKVRNKINLM